MSTNEAGQVQNRQKKGRGYPNPTPTLAISARLERVRTHFGFNSKRAFHEALKDGWADALSYEAIRNYHYNREPPPSYLARVVEVFPDVRMAWLVTGTGPMLDSELQSEKTTQGAAALGPGLERLQWIEHCPPVVRAALVHHLTERDAARWRAGVGTPSDPPGEAEAVWGDITAPFKGRVPQDWAAFTRYALGALHALNLSLQVETTTTTEEED